MDGEVAQGERRGKLQSTTLLSLTGYLDLLQKSWRGRTKKHYWLWFDEQTCHLKLYRNQESYQQSVFEPLMAIDLRTAIVTPAMVGEDLLTNQFKISIDGQTYIFGATNSEKAHTWIKKLQEKREQWIHRETAHDRTDLSKRKTLQPINERPGVLLPDEDREDFRATQPSSVRNIVSKHMKLESCNSLPVDSIGLNSPPSNTSTSYTFSTTLGDELEGSVRRELLELRHAYHFSQEEVTKLQKEVLQLKDRMAKKNEEIVQLNCNIDELTENLAKSNGSRAPDNYELEVESLRDIIEQYKRSVQSLVDEIELKTLQEKENERRVHTERMKVHELDREVNKFKAKYVTLLSDKFKVVVPNPAGADEERKAEDVEAVYQEELLQLLQRESDENALLNYRSSFKDEYGDWHDWQSDTNVQHYLCRQLYLHFTQEERELLVQEWTDFLKFIKPVKGKTYLDILPSNERVKKRELRNLVRKGIPLQYRTRIWSSLVYRLVGKTKEVKDNASGSGNTYYASLLNSTSESAAEKQIMLDLHRTLPNNIHFRSKGHGTAKLKNILIAYSRHNKNVEYCQGMNLIAAIGLLFLDEETTFWFLQAVIEKLLPTDYFTPGLIGAQADQAVLRDLLPQKLPQLSSHLDLHGIDVTLITFNWFLTLFIDAMPTESVLRILDCFLMEGSKILFRVGLGVLKVNTRHLLSITDPVVLFQTLKEITKHTFDIDQLLEVAFSGSVPFPSRAVLSTRHLSHYGDIKQQWILREKELKEREVRSKMEKLNKQALRPRVLERSFRENQRARRHLTWECGCVRMKGKEEEEVEEVWLCCGDRHQGHVAIVSISGGKWCTKIPHYDISSRVISVGYVNSDLVVMGTLDFNLHGFHCTSEKKMWTMKMPDSVLAIRSTQEQTVFVALADGFVAVLQNVTMEPPERGPLLIHVGSGAVTCIAIGPGDQLWCGCSNAITILSSKSFEPVHSIALEELKRKVYKMETSEHGVWVSFRSSSVISLYEGTRYVRLLHVDYNSILPSSSAFLNPLDCRVTSMIVVRDELWLGTGNGMILRFLVIEAVPEKEAAIAELVASSSEPVTAAQSETDGHGLLTPNVEEVATENRKEQSSHFHNRRTVFGRTLRGGVARQVPKRTSREVFRLQHISSSNIDQTESVRVLLPIHDGVVSCVNSSTNWESSVQGWKLYQNEWNVEYLAVDLLESRVRRDSTTATTHSFCTSDSSASNET